MFSRSVEPIVTPIAAPHRFSLFVFIMSGVQITMNPPPVRSNAELSSEIVALKGSIKKLEALVVRTQRDLQEMRDQQIDRHRMMERIRDVERDNEELERKVRDLEWWKDKNNLQLIQLHREMRDTSDHIRSVTTQDVYSKQGGN